jgi:hypothetical protein
MLTALEERNIEILDNHSIIKRVNKLAGIKESDTGLARSTSSIIWYFSADKQHFPNE